MEDHTRRGFLGRLLAGAGVWLLSMLPGTFFNRGKAFAIDTLESVLPKINRSNITKELPTLALSQEDKLAVAAVTLIPPSELKGAIDKIKAGEKGGVAIGVVCGNGCDGYGLICGSSCSPKPDTMGAFDPKGQLGIRLKSVNKSAFLRSMDKAMAFK